MDNSGATPGDGQQDKRVQDFKNILQKVKQKEIDKKASDRVRDRKLEKMKQSMKAASAEQDDDDDESDEPPRPPPTGAQKRKNLKKTYEEVADDDQSESDPSGDAVRSDDEYSSEEERKLKQQLLRMQRKKQVKKEKLKKEKLKKRYEQVEEEEPQDYEEKDQRLLRKLQKDQRAYDDSHQEDQIKQDLKKLKEKSREEKLRKQFMVQKEKLNRNPYSPEEKEETKEQRRVKRLNKMLRDTKDSEGREKGFGRNQHYFDQIREMRLGDLLEKHTMESQRTIALYFINLVSMVFLLLIYVGLFIIMSIAFLLHSWDRYNNQEEDYSMFSSQDYHELETREEHQRANKIKLISHQGHNHWMTPFDFSDVQVSAWFAFIPGVAFMVQNFHILVLNNTQEYQFFGAGRGLKILMICMLTSQVMLCGYLMSLSVNLSKELGNGKELSQFLIWQNFEGLALYMVICVQMSSLYGYGNNKFSDFMEVIKQRDASRDWLKQD